MSYIKMELCQKGTLEDYLQERTSINKRYILLLIS